MTVASPVTVTTRRPHSFRPGLRPRAGFQRIVSAILFGLTAWSIPGIVAAACGDYLGSRLAPAALGFVTLFFDLGQAAGPSVAGALADALVLRGAEGTGSFGPAFLLAAGVTFLGGLGSLWTDVQIITS